MLSNDLMNSDKASVSGSENGDEPAYVGAHGFVEAPDSEINN